MLKIFLAVITCSLSCSIHSQNTIDYGTHKSHEYYVSLLENSKEAYFIKIIEQYENYINNYPENITAKIELCKFIGNSYFDEYEEFNLKYEETEECIDALYRNYRDNPKVIIYRAQTLYGEEQFEILDKAETDILNKNKKWSDFDKAEIYQMLGQYYWEDTTLSLKYYEKAQLLNESLDLSIPIARAHLTLGDMDKAKTILNNSLEKDSLRWNIAQKATMLLELKSSEKALELYESIAQKDSTLVNNNDVAKALENLGNLVLAREYLVKDTIGAWNKAEKLQNLYTYDMSNSTAKTTLSVYRELQKLNPYHDFFGVNRFKIFLKDASLKWNLSELIHFGFILIVIVLFLILPYLWVLPIYHLGLFLNKKSIKIISILDFNWNMKHFWLISFVYLFVQFIIFILFDYEALISSLFSVAVSDENTYIVNSSLANAMITYIVLMAILTLFFLDKKRLRYLYTTNLGISKIIRFSILFVIFNILINNLLGKFIDLDTPLSDFNSMLSARKEISAILMHYGFWIGFLLVCIIVPIYEEVIFRGVIFSAVEKQLGFITANIVQAVLFALVHYDLKRFLFYFLFALITGYVVKKTKGLLTGIIFHGVHNFAVLVAMYYLIEKLLPIN